MQSAKIHFAVSAAHGGIAQLARACGSYPQCPRFESRCRYHPEGAAFSPAPSLRPVGQVVKTPPFHGGNMGSSPVRVTKKERVRTGLSLFWCRGMPKGFPRKRPGRSTTVKEANMNHSPERGARCSVCRRRSGGSELSRRLAEARRSGACADETMYGTILTGKNQCFFGVSMNCEAAGCFRCDKKCGPQKRPASSGCGIKI